MLFVLLSFNDGSMQKAYTFGIFSLKFDKIMNIWVQYVCLIWDSGILAFLQANMTHEGL